MFPKKTPLPAVKRVSPENIQYFVFVKYFEWLALALALAAAVCKHVFSLVTFHPTAVTCLQLILAICIVLNGRIFLIDLQSVLNKLAVSCDTLLSGRMV